MTKILKSKYKISRRLGVNVWGRDKDPSIKKNYRPGVHGPVMSRKLSDYARQLNAKQLLKGYYGRIREKQFKKIFNTAVRLKGDTGENLVGLLERRLDAVVYRMNFAATIFGARQVVSHGHIKVNGQVVDIASYVLKEGDEIELTEKAKSMEKIATALELIERPIPEYITLDVSAKKGQYIRVPKLADIPYPVEMAPQLVVEFYSR